MGIATLECTYEVVDGYSDRVHMRLWIGIATLECTYEVMDRYSDIRVYI